MLAQSMGTAHYLRYVTRGLRDRGHSAQSRSHARAEHGDSSLRSSLPRGLRDRGHWSARPRPLVCATAATNYAIAARGGFNAS